MTAAAAAAAVAKRAQSQRDELVQAVEPVEQWPEETVGAGVGWVV